MNSLETSARAVRLEQKLAQLVYSGINSPVSLSCSILLRYGEFEQLAAKRINPDNYTNAEAFADDYQAVMLLSKSRLLPVSVDREAAAFEKYVDAERACYRTNVRFYNGTKPQGLGEEELRMLSSMRTFIRRVLGRIPSDLEERMSFGPGSTVDISGVVTSGRKFMSKKLSMTDSMVNYACFRLPPMWRRSVETFKVINAAKLVFVPKDSMKDRAIEIQPTLNIYFQKGIGSWIRDRLRRFGIDLRSQDRNKSLARLGSLTGHLATLDLSSASDTIAFNLVKYLLPREWFELLCLCRVGRVSYKGTERLLEKFSAMGNGYTFELESLIFAAAIHATYEVNGYAGDIYSVYGDDMVISTRAYGAVIDTLEFLGFSVNDEKSFGKGAFRESCGADYFQGTNVRPIFFRKEAECEDTFRELCYTYANNLLRYSSHRGGGLFRDRRFYSAWLECYLTLPSRLRFRVPLGYESGGFLGDFDECRPTRTKRVRTRGLGGWNFRYHYRRPRHTSRYVEGVYMVSLHAGGTDFSLGSQALRGRFLPAATRQGHSLEWPWFGPWL